MRYNEGALVRVVSSRCEVPAGTVGIVASKGGEGPLADDDRAYLVRTPDGQWFTAHETDIAPVPRE